MGYQGRLKDRLKAQKLRRKGYSYKEILKEISVSKDTISRWCKNIVLTKAQKQRLLDNKQLGQKKGSLIASENKRKLRIEKINAARNSAVLYIGDMNKRDTFITGIGLYAAEGDKTDGRCGFANADPQLISFMVNWFLEFTKVPLSKMRGVLYIHENLSEEKAKIFWSDKTGIPLVQFRKSYIVKRKTKYRKNIHQYGVFSLRFSNSEIHRRIMGWIYAVFSDKIIERSRLGSNPS